MIAPVITAPVPAVRVIAAGQPFSLALSATGNPSAWAISGQPPGLVISSAGIISGTVSTLAADTTYTASITATNEYGTSAAVTLKLWALGQGTGSAPASAFAAFLDWNLDRNTLAIPGVGKPQPASAPPEFGVPAPLCGWTLGDGFPLSIQFTAGGAVLDIDDLTALEVWLRDRDSDTGLKISSGSITRTGGNDTARHEIAIDLDATNATLSGWIGEGENADGRDLAEAGLLTLPAHTFRDLDLELVAKKATSIFSATVASSISSFTSSQTKNNTIFVPLTSTTATAYYSLTLNYVSPSDTAMQKTLTIGNATVSYANGSYGISGTLPSSVVGNATSDEQWDVTLSIQSITANATGISLAARAVSSAAPTFYGTTVSPSATGAEDLSVNANGTISIGGAGTIVVEFLNGATSLDTFTMEDGDTLAELVSKLTTALGADAAGVKLVDASDTIYFFVSESYPADTTSFNSSGTNSPAFGFQSFTQVTYSNCSWSLAVASTATPVTTRRTSLPAPVRVYQR